MSDPTPLDCVIIGYNDVDFQAYAASKKRLAKHSGAYRDALHNSVRLGGQRLTYMELLNHALTRAAGRDPRLSAFEVPSLGVTYLTSFLRRRGFAAEMVSYFNFEREKLRDLLASSPRAVAVTTTYYVDHDPILGVVEFVRRHCPETKILVGGPHIYNIACHSDLNVQDYVFKTLGADVYVNDSQGELTLARVLEALRDGGDLSRVPNLIYSEDGGRSFARTARQKESNDLDENTVDWTLFRADENIFAHPVYLRTARSCPFSCSFCNYPTMAGAHSVNELDNLERQFRFLHEQGVRDLIFIDDTFNVPLPRFKNLLRMMIRNQFEFRWISFFRCSNADDVAFDLMQESGCRQVFLGIESGDQEILNNMRKFADVEKYKEGIRKLKERGISTYSSIIAGFPGETEDSFKRTLEFLDTTRPTFFNFQLYYHDLRTPIHQEAEKYRIHGAGYSWQHASMNWQEAADWVEHGFATVEGSVPMTLYNFSMWSLPYLLAKGLSFEEVKDFARIARQMLVASFADEDVDFSTEEARLVDLLRGSRAAAA